MQKIKDYEDLLADINDSVKDFEGDSEMNEAIDQIYNGKKENFDIGEFDLEKLTLEDEETEKNFDFETFVLKQLDYDNYNKLFFMTVFKQNEDYFNVEEIRENLAFNRFLGGLERTSNKLLSYFSVEIVNLERAIRKLNIVPDEVTLEILQKDNIIQILDGIKRRNLIKQIEYDSFKRLIYFRNDILHGVPAYILVDRFDGIRNNLQIALRFTERFSRIKKFDSLIEGLPKESTKSTNWLSYKKAGKRKYTKELLERITKQIYGKLN